MESKEILDRFLNIPIASSQGVFEIFAQLPGAVWHKGEKPLQQFVYVPGTREDRVVLVAHGDTVWDAFYGHPQEAVLRYEDGIYTSGNEKCGIGADDRAGCAMVWALRNSGHSLLILDGEEKGKIGASNLKKTHKKLYREINRHRFILELDWAGAGGCLFNQVDNTQSFKDYIQTVFTDSHKKWRQRPADPLQPHLRCQPLRRLAKLPHAPGTVELAPMGRKLGKAHPIPGKTPTPVSDPSEMATPPGHPQPGRTNFAKAGSSQLISEK